MHARDSLERRLGFDEVINADYPQTVTEYLRADLAPDTRAIREVTLDPAHQYLMQQYGQSPLNHPIDRARILALLDEETK